MEPVVIVLIIAVIVAGLIYGWYAAAKRRKELREFAQANGLWFSETRAYDVDDHFPAFGCLRQGSNRYAYNQMGGTWDSRQNGAQPAAEPATSSGPLEYQIKAFDYHYETHSTDSKGRRQTHHHHFSAVIIGAPIPLEPLFIRPEGFFDKITEFFGADDIDFESAEFSRKFYVKAPEKRWAYDVLHARTMEFLLGQPQFYVEFARSSVIVYRNRCFKVQDIRKALEVACGLLERLPEYVVRQQQEKYA